MSREGRMRAPQSLAAIIGGYIDPRPAEYDGIRMRSQLEADFAAHLDRIGIEWVYEPAIFGPTGSGYLPDFRVKSEDGRESYVEVKPTLAEVDQAKRRMAVIWESCPGAVLVVACAEGSTFFAAARGGEWLAWTELWAHA